MERQLDTMDNHNTAYLPASLVLPLPNSVNVKTDSEPISLQPKSFESQCCSIIQFLICAAHFFPICTSRWSLRIHPSLHLNLHHRQGVPSYALSLLGFCRATVGHGSLIAK